MGRDGFPQEIWFCVIRRREVDVEHQTIDLLNVGLDHGQYMDLGLEGRIFKEKDKDSESCSYPMYYICGCFSFS